MMDATVTSLQKNGKDSVMNGVAKLRVQNMVIVLNVRIQRKDGMKNDLHLPIATYNLHHRRSGWEVVNKAMIQNIVVKTVDAIEGKYDVFADGVQIADKVSMVTFFMEVGKIPHMLIAADFMNLEIDGVKAEVTYSEPLPERKNVDDEIQHVAYDDAQLGREK